MTSSVPYVLEVGGQEVVLTPNAAHEYTAPTEQVALGYGVTPDAVRMVKSRRAEEFVEGKHYCVTDRYAPGDGQLTLWTKRGIVRLGFFIRSARARLFRDMAEDLVIGVMTAQASQPTAPALISARAFGKAWGTDPKHGATILRRAGFLPTHHYLEPRCKAPAYLFPFDEIQARYPHLPLTPFEGEARPGLGPVAHVVRAQMQTKAAKKHHPRLIPTDTQVEQLARRLLSLEAQKKAVLKELAALGGAA